jgi:hypothetical protein
MARIYGTYQPSDYLQDPEKVSVLGEHELQPMFTFESTNCEDPNECATFRIHHECHGVLVVIQAIIRTRGCPKVRHV